MRCRDDVEVGIVTAFSFFYSICVRITTNFFCFGSWGCCSEFWISSSFRRVLPHILPSCCHSRGHRHRHMVSSGHLGRQHHHQQDQQQQAPVHHHYSQLRKRYQPSYLKMFVTLRKTRTTSHRQSSKSVFVQSECMNVLININWNESGRSQQSFHELF